MGAMDIFWRRGAYPLKPPPLFAPMLKPD